MKGLPPKSKHKPNLTANQLHLPQINNKRVYSLTPQSKRPGMSSSLSESRNVSITLQEDKSTGKIQYQIKTRVCTPSSQHNLSTSSIKLLSKFGELKKDNELSQALSVLEEAKNHSMFNTNNTTDITSQAFKEGGRNSSLQEDEKKIKLLNKIRHHYNQNKKQQDQRNQLGNLMKKVAGYSETKHDKKKVDYFQVTLYKEKEVFPVDYESLGRSPRQGIKSRKRFTLWEKTLMTQQMQTRLYEIHREQSNGNHHMTTPEIKIQNNRSSNLDKQQQMKKRNTNAISEEGVSNLDLTSEKTNTIFTSLSPMKKTPYTVTSKSRSPNRLKELRLLKQQTEEKTIRQIKDIKKDLAINEQRLKKEQSDLLMLTLIKSQQIVQQGTEPKEILNIQKIKQSKINIALIQKKLQQLNKKETILTDQLKQLQYGDILEDLKEEVDKSEEIADLFDEQKRMSDLKRTPMISKNNSKGNLHHQSSNDHLQLTRKTPGPHYHSSHHSIKKSQTKLTVVSANEKPPINQNQLLKDLLQKTRDKIINTSKVQKEGFKSTMELLILDQKKKENQRVQGMVKLYQENIRKKHNSIQQQLLVRQSSDEEIIWNNLERMESNPIEKKYEISIIEESKIDEEMLFGENPEHSKIYNLLDGYNSVDISQIEEKQLIQDQMPIMNPIMQAANQFIMKEYQIEYKKEMDAHEKLQKRFSFLNLIKNSDDLTQDVAFTQQELDQIEYIQQCIQNCELPLPMLDKIKQKTLKLRNYGLTKALCAGLAKLALNNDLNHIIMVNNNINDMSMSHIIEGCYHGKYIRNIHLEKNNVGRSSTEYLAKILSRPPPNNLETLTLYDCKVGSIPIENLLRVLQNRCYLKSLKLIKSKLSSENLILLSDIINNQAQLHFLDISWNDFPQQNFLKFLESIEQNQNLRELVLSMLPFKGPLSYQIVDSVCDQIRLNNNLLHLDLSHVDLKNDEFLILGDSMEKSKSLISIHLSGNKMTKPLIRQIKIKLKIIKTAHQSQDDDIMDIDQNNSSTQDNISTNHQRQKSEINLAYQRSSFMINSEYQKTPQKVARQSNIFDFVMSNKSGQQQFFDKALLQNSFNQLPSTMSIVNSDIKNKHSRGKFFTMPKDIIIFQRQLGHCEIPLAYRWKQSDYCWYCEKWQYVIFIYSQKMDPNEIMAAQKQVLFQQMRTQQFSKELFHDKFNKELIDSYMLECQIQGSFIKNQQQSMKGIESFLRKLEENYETHYQFGERLISSDDHEMVHKKKKKQQLQKKLQKSYLERKKILDFITNVSRRFKTLNDAKTYISALSNRGDLSDEDYRYCEFKDIDYNRNQKLMEKIIRLTQDHNPIILNSKLLNKGPVDLGQIPQNSKELCQFDLDEDIYIFAGIVPPGLHQFQIKTKRRVGLQSQEMGSNMAYQIVIDVPKRCKDLNVFYRKRKKRRIFRYFQKEKSIFRRFKHDSDEILDEMFQNDIARSKIHRMIRNQHDVRNIIHYSFQLEETQEVLRQNIIKLKDVFLKLVAKSRYPNISWLDFADFCTDMCIPDKTCSISQIDMAFIATNVELEKNDGNPDKDLNRAEFWEIIIRIANEKFRKSGQTDRFSVAFKKLLKENIFANHDPIMETQDFRDKYLYSLDVDDIFKLNKITLYRLFTQFHNLNKRYISLKDCIWLVCEQAQKLGFKEDIVKTLFAYSKQTVVDEDADSHRYEQMRFVEFLEFIGRLGYMVQIPEEHIRSLMKEFEDKEEIGYPEKLEYVIEILLKTINCKRKARENIKDVYETESDYDQD